MITMEQRIVYVHDLSGIKNDDFHWLMNNRVLTQCKDPQVRFLYIAYMVAKGHFESVIFPLMENENKYITKQTYELQDVFDNLLIEIPNQCLDKIHVQMPHLPDSYHEATPHDLLQSNSDILFIFCMYECGETGGTAFSNTEFPTLSNCPEYMKNLSLLPDAVSKILKPDAWKL